MKTAEVRITVDIPVEATDEQIKQWLKYETGYCADIPMSNPLSHYDLETDKIEIKIN